MDNHGRQNNIMSRRALIFYLMKDYSKPSIYDIVSLPFVLYNIAHSLTAIVFSRSYRELLSQEYSYKFQNYDFPAFVFGRSDLDVMQPKIPVNAHKLEQQIMQPDITNHNMDASTPSVKARV